MVRLMTSIKSTQKALAPFNVVWQAPIIIKAAINNGGADVIWKVLDVSAILRFQSNIR